MDIVDIHEAEIHLAHLIEKAAAGQAFIIARGGKPMVKVMPVDTNHMVQRRVGFLLGEFAVPKDFDRMGEQRHVPVAACLSPNPEHDTQSQ